MIDLKKKFLHREFCYLCFVAALGMTRKIPFYKNSTTDIERENIRKYLRDVLWEFIKIYSNKIGEQTHINTIKLFKTDINKKYITFLEGNGMSFGRAQKLINLYLKYMWVSGFIEEPPHCPIDSIIIKKVGKNYNGPSYNNMGIKHYYEIIALIKMIKGYQSIAQWELEVFNRR